MDAMALRTQRKDVIGPNKNHLWRLRLPSIHHANPSGFGLHHLLHLVECGPIDVVKQTNTTTIHTITPYVCIYIYTPLIVRVRSYKITWIWLKIPQLLSPKIRCIDLPIGPTLLSSVWCARSSVNSCVTWREHLWPPPGHLQTTSGAFHSHGGYPKNGWFTMENPMRIADLGAFLGNHHVVMKKLSGEGSS